MELIKVGKVETNFDVSRSLSKAEKFVFSKTRTGNRFNDFKSERLLKNALVHIISTETLASSEKGKYPILLYNKETNACHQGRQVWLKTEPLTSQLLFELVAVHEFTHLSDQDMLGAIGQDLAYDSMRVKYVRTHPLQAFSQHLEWSQHFEKSGNKRGWQLLPEFLRFLKSTSSDSEAILQGTAVLKAISEGRARFMQLLYFLENGAEKEARVMMQNAHFRTLSSIVSRLPFSPYEIGLSFMLNLERLIGTPAAMKKTLIDPPKNMHELLSPQDYLKGTRNEKNP